MLLSILVPGILQLLWTNEAATGLIYLLIAIIGSAVISVVFSTFIFFYIGGLVSLIFYLGVGYFAWLRAKPKMYPGSARTDDDITPSWDQGLLPIAAAPRLSGEWVGAY